MEPKISTYLHNLAVRRGIPLHGTFELTARCNFNCPMCYVHLSAEEQRRRGRELTGEEWISVAEQAKRAGTVYLLLTGGEPLLHLDFYRIYEALSQMGFFISINSNASLLNGELLALFQKYPPTRFNITLYSLSREGYLTQCGVPAYDSVIANLHALKNCGISIRINVTITPANQEEMPAIVRTAQELGVPIAGGTYLSPPIRVDHAMAGKNFRPEPEEAARLLAAYDRLRLGEEAFHRRAQTILSMQTAEKAAGAPEPRTGSPMQCRAGRSSYWIDWQGNLMACGELSEPSASIPALGFQEAWQKVRAAVEEVRLAPECAACPLQDVCRPCAAKNLSESGSFANKPDYVCRMTHAYLNCLY